MGSELVTMRLVDCMDAIIDYRGKTPKKTTSGIQDVTEFIAEEDYDSWMVRGIPQCGDVVLTTEAPLGEVAQLDSRKVALAQRVITLRGKKGLLSNDYLAYLLQSRYVQHQLDGRGTGSTVKGIKQSELKEVELTFPSYDVQEQFASHLKKIDVKIDLNRQINRTLEQMAQTLFKSWFVDFDPVIDNAFDAGSDIPEVFESRVERRKAVRESAEFKPLPDDVRQLFPSEFEESELGWIPKGWKTSTAGQELTVKGGSTPSTKNSDFWEGGHIAWTSPKDLSDNTSKIMLDTSRKITEHGLAKITSGLLPVNTVLMSSRAPIGYLALTKIPLAINQGYIAIPETKRLSQEFTMYWLDSVMDEIKGVAGGTTFAEISKKVFKEIGIIVPDKSVITAFSNVVKRNLDKVTSNVEQSKSLTTLRDTLLPKLISGELRLDSPEVEQAKALVE